MKLLGDELSKMKSFFTIDEFMEKIHAQDKNIGIATIYRFLSEKENNHELHSYTCERKKVYSRSDVQHCLFICEKCGKTEHLKIEKIDFLKSKIQGEMCHFQIDVHGVCNACLKKR